MQLDPQSIGRHFELMENDHDHFQGGLGSSNIYNIDVAVAIFKYLIVASRSDYKVFAIFDLIQNLNR